MWELSSGNMLRRLSNLLAPSKPLKAPAISYDCIQSNEHQKYGVASISNTLQNLKQAISHIMEITLYSKEK